MGAPRTTTQRGLGYAHRQRKAQLLPLWIGRPCPKCGRTLLEGQALDAGHSVPRCLDPTSVADQIEHASCNRAEGASLARLTKRRRTSRAWL